MGLLDELLDDEQPRKRTMSIRDKQILLKRAGGRCENCGTPIDFTQLMVGHKTAYSKGGGTSFRNCVALCYSCNKLQGTDSWETFQRKQGKTPKGPATRVEATGMKRKKRRRRHDGEDWGLFPDLGKLF